ncbi:MAG TPA: DUF1801 domain-containing protein [Acidimicrobiales bacterium]|jgi:hypothetical protein|nr:DUF1801 domain-containing protein [Acidimicrobiales bacterium]
MSSTDVDEYVADKLEPWQQDIVEALRELVRESAPDSHELITYGSPGWKGTSNKLLAIISPSKKHITFSFSRGAELDDAYDLLEGSGKVTRHVKIKDMAGVHHEAFRGYVAQAVKLDEA